MFSLKFLLHYYSMDWVQTYSSSFLKLHLTQTIECATFNIFPQN